MKKAEGPWGALSSAEKQARESVERATPPPPSPTHTLTHTRVHTRFSPQRLFPFSRYSSALSFRHIASGGAPTFSARDTSLVQNTDRARHSITRSLVVGAPLSRSVYRGVYKTTRAEMMAAEPADGMKIFGGFVASVGAAYLLFTGLNKLFIAPQPDTMSKEWKDAEFAKQAQRGQNPVLGGGCVACPCPRLHVHNIHTQTQHNTTQHITSHHITSHHITSHHITSHHIDRLTHTGTHVHITIARPYSCCHVLIVITIILGTADPSKLGNLFFWGQTVFSSPRTTTPPAAVRGTRTFHGTSVNTSPIASCCTVPIHTTYISRERGTHARMHARSHTYIHMHTHRHAHAHASVSECCARENNTHVLMSS
jgi:hypothetical protein